MEKIFFLFFFLKYNLLNKVEVKVTVDDPPGWAHGCLIEQKHLEAMKKSKIYTR